ncbi:alpha/beta hydrolase [Halioglobus maricola]|uniref:Alpha/beta hydrolase n=1 Tax=Halioglobus maricola TaxID=2601894 RepID=A0A5P9NNL8_9GAMM|nr:alpha/beta hydrolase [Halioglobus maricola]QFU77463.1 alpha/beta hydrolase [Halioglobus maricola]
MAEYVDHYYQSTDGLRLYARDYACRTPGRAEPPVVLCMHGLTRNSADFAGLASQLSQACRVVSVDCRGRGKSDYDPVVANYNPAVYVQDMLTLLEDLQIDKVILCGTSMGGLMSIMMGATQPGRILGMVINDIGPEIDPRGLDRIKAYVGKTKPVHNWDDAVAQAREINGIAFPDFTDEEWKEFTRGIYNDVDGIPVLAYDPAISQPIDSDKDVAAPPDLWPLFDAVSGIPLLVVRGETSDILARSCVDTMRERKPDLQYVEIPGRGHAPTLNEALALEAIEQFLQGLP